MGSGVAKSKARDYIEILPGDCKYFDRKHVLDRSESNRDCPRPSPRFELVTVEDVEGVDGKSTVYSPGSAPLNNVHINDDKTTELKENRRTCSVSMQSCSRKSSTTSKHYQDPTVVNSQFERTLHKEEYVLSVVQTPPKYQCWIKDDGKVEGQVIENIGTLINADDSLSGLDLICSPESTPKIPESNLQISKVKQSAVDLPPQLGWWKVLETSESVAINKLSSHSSSCNPLPKRSEFDRCNVECSKKRQRNKDIKKRTTRLTQQTQTSETRPLQVGKESFNKATSALACAAPHFIHEDLHRNKSTVSETEFMLKTANIVQQKDVSIQTENAVVEKVHKTTQVSCAPNLTECWSERVDHRSAGVKQADITDIASSKKLGLSVRSFDAQVQVGPGLAGWTVIHGLGRYGHLPTFYNMQRWCNLGPNAVDHSVRGRVRPRRSSRRLKGAVSANQCLPRESGHKSTSNNTIVLSRDSAAFSSSKNCQTPSPH